MRLCTKDFDAILQGLLRVIVAFITRNDSSDRGLACIIHENLKRPVLHHRITNTTIIADALAHHLRAEWQAKDDAKRAKFSARTYAKIHMRHNNFYFYFCALLHFFFFFLAKDFLLLTDFCRENFRSNYQLSLYKYVRNSQIYWFLLIFTLVFPTSLFLMKVHMVALWFFFTRCKM